MKAAGAFKMVCRESYATPCSPIYGQRTRAANTRGTHCPLLAQSRHATRANQCIRFRGQSGHGACTAKCSLMTQSGQTGYRAAPTASSGGSMSIRAQGGFGIDDLTRLLGDSKRYEVFNFRVRAVAGENAVKPGTLVKRLGVGERLPLVNTASNAVLTPDELLADKSLFLRKSRRDLEEVRKAFVLADRRGQLVANDCGYHVIRPPHRLIAEGAKARRDQEVW